jgi:8-oxo-dGTP diphosphatase
MPEKENKTLIGIGVMVMKDGKVLLGKRKSSHGAGEYAFPGGHLEYMESFEQCARREIAEECGIKVGEISFQCLTNMRQYAPRHYMHVGLLTSWISGEPATLEPDRCEGWDWYGLDHLPAPLYEPSSIQIETYRNGLVYRDASDAGIVGL